MIKKRKDNTYVINRTLVAFDYPNPTMTVNVYTLCDMHDENNLQALEQVLDQSPIVKAKLIDEKDPPRKKAIKFKGVLTELVNNSRFDAVPIQSTSGSKPPISSMLSLRSKGRVGPLGRLDRGYSMVSIVIQKNDMEAIDAEADEIKNLFLSVCTAVKAFFGYCTEHSMVTQRNIYLAQAVEDVRDRKKLPDYNAELSDVYWLNYYGPGYVAFWGQKKIDVLEKAYNVMHDCNNGIIVQTTPKPIVADENVHKIIDYQFKKPMYEIMGYNTFIHETHQQGQPGQYVPTLESMRKLV